MMAKPLSQESICSLVKVGTLKLERKAGHIPVYNSLVVTEETLLVIDSTKDLQLYSLRDGKLLSSYKLEDCPTCICLINKTRVAVCMDDGYIAILSFQSIDDIKLVKQFDVSHTKTNSRHFMYKSYFRTESPYSKARFINYAADTYYSVAKLNSDKLVVSGLKCYGKWMCWNVVSITNGLTDSTHYICDVHFRGDSHLVIKENTVYISCRTDYSTTNGVYAYDIFNPQIKKFLYQHQELKTPGAIIADLNSIFVSDFVSNSIHQLTDSGQLVAIHTVSSRPSEIFYDDQHGVLYTTHAYMSNEIVAYRVKHLHQPENLHQTVLNRCLPELLMNLDDNAVMIYIQQNGLFHDLTLRDILDQQTTSDKISKLIELIKQRDRTYEQFKECLVLTKQADLRKMLEEEEAKLAAEMRQKH